MDKDDFDLRVGCGAHGCIMRIDPSGPGVGTCRCLPREMPPSDRVRLRRQIAALRDKLAEVERERDEARAALEASRSRIAFADAGLKTLTDAGWTLAGERDALRAIIAGRTTPPTDAEIEAHDAATGGFWMVFCEDDFDLDMLSNPEDRDAWVKAGAIGWVPYSDGRPCAWPVVP